jgi:pimeloyl-ACP methyl ester carboxylesterase
MSARLWWESELTQNLLDAGYQVIAFENRGIPPSDVPPAPYSVSQMAQDTIDLLEHLDRGPYTLMGASLGGLITQTVALQRPSLVHTAVFINGCGNYSAFMRPYLRIFVELYEKDSPPHTVMTVLYLPLFIPPTQYANENMNEEVLKIIPAFFPENPMGLLGQYHAGLSWSKEDHVEELKGLQIPALAIANEYDVCFPPDCVKNAVSQMPKGEYVEVTGATHVDLNPENKKKRNSSILQFLSRHMMS